MSKMKAKEAKPKQSQWNSRPKQVLVPWVKAWHSHFSCIIKQNARRQASQIDSFTNKLDNSDKRTTLWVSWLIFILNQSYYQTQIAD